MLDRSVRPLLVMGVVLGSALPGFVASASAAPVALEGGCWSYVPAAGTDLDDATGGIDAADPQIPWGSENLLDLTTSGATSVGGQRTFALAMTLPTGLEEADSATYWFDLVGADQVRTELPPVSVDLTAEDATESLPEVSVEGAVELAAPGGTTLVLRNVVFTVADLDQRVVCNGQTNPEASDVGGSNPATDPLDTNVTAAFDVAPAPSVAIDSVQGQDVRYAARAGDAVSISWSGLASDGAVSAAVCDAATCEPVSTPTSSADGAGQATLPVIASVVPGGGTVAVKDELGNEAVAPLRLLGAPTLSLRDNAKATRLRFAGADWDPTRHVRVRAFDDNGKQVGQRRLRAGGLGRVAGVVKVKKGIEVSELRAQQARAGGALEAAIDVDLGGTAPPGKEGGDDESKGSTASPNTSASSSPSTTSQAAPSMETPPTVDLPVNEVPAPGADLPAAQGDVAVTSAELRGATRIQDLFGAAPERELRLTVENLGDVAITAPGLSIAVGKGDPEPVFLSDGIGRLEPGQVARITVPIALPVGAHGTYTITGRVGDGERGEFGLTWETYPWGLLGLNGLGVLLVAWALQRRFMAPAAPLIAAGTPPVTETLGVADGEAVIDLDTLERWWALQVATSGEAADAVVDEGAVDRWIERCRERDLTQL